VSSTESESLPPVSLEDLVALNEEIAALVRAGVPLELGLETAPGGPLAGELASLVVRLQRGESLGEALEAEGSRFPPLYRAIVQAGVRAGRLPLALEAVNAFVASVQDLRRKISLSLIYPLVVLCLTYVLFVFLVVEFAPRVQSVHRDFDLPSGAVLDALVAAGTHVAQWVWIGPTVLLVLVGGWIFTSRALDRTGLMGILRRLPWIRRIFQDQELGNFCQLLGLLIEHQVPLDEALALTAETIGDRRLKEDARQLEVTHARGLTLADSLSGTSRLPAMLKLMIATAGRPETLVETLQRAGESYRERAAERAAWFKLVLPVALAVFVGGTAALFYALTLFLPLTHMLYEMGRA